MSEEHAKLIKTYQDLLLQLYFDNREVSNEIMQIIEEDIEDILIIEGLKIEKIEEV